MVLYRSPKNYYKPKISVIIAARNEEKHISRCLDHISKQDYPEYEVIVINDRSTDKTEEIVHNFPGLKNLKLITVTQLPENIAPKKNALSEGIKAATGEILLLTDADCKADNDWISSTVKCFNPEVGMVVGYSPIDPVNPNSVFENFVAIDSLGLASASAGSAFWGSPITATGRNLAYRKSVFEQVGGFSKIAHFVSGDDDLFLKLVKNTGWKIAYNLKGLISTIPPERFENFINQKIRQASKGRHYSPKIIGIGVILFTFNLLFCTYGYYSLLIWDPVLSKIVLSILFCNICNLGTNWKIRMERSGTWEKNSMTGYYILFGLALLIYISMALIIIVGLFLKEKGKNAKTPLVSVIVAARNEENFIETCVTKILNQDYPNYELIVIDDRSTDMTPLKLAALSDPKLRKLKIFEKPDEVSGKKNALVHAIKESKGEILLFTDADCEVKPTWVSTMVKYFSDETGCVIGYSAVKSSGFFQKWQAFDFRSGMAAAMGATNMGLVFAASGQNFAYRKDAYEKAGGLEQVLHRISGDDVLMLQLIRKKTNYKTKFASDPNAFNLTKPETTLSGFIHQRSRWASNGGIMASLNPIFFCFLISVSIFNILLPLGLMINQITAGLSIFGLVVKLIVDFCGSYLGAKTFYERYSWREFFAWFIMQPVYIAWVGTRGVLGKFKWK